MSEKLHPYVIFLPTEKKEKILSAISAPKQGVDILRYALKQGTTKSLYQKDSSSKLTTPTKPS
jgi:hypothetical protein